MADVPVDRRVHQYDGHDCAHALRPDRNGLEDRAMVGWAGSVAEAAVPAAPKARP
ncbi:hypothetical protein ACISU4_07105 [Streptomyces wuyuanensis]|uniref:hypothetical protein n=1 Tax=Streptomyces wuyuanensis TaxID=1196353 RepID=UPI00383007E6